MTMHGDRSRDLPTPGSIESAPLRPRGSATIRASRIVRYCRLVSVTADDDDTRGVSVSETGNTATYTVVLDREPTGDVTAIDLRRNEADERDGGRRAFRDARGGEPAH